MRRDWSAEELSELWTLGPAELVLVGGLPDASKVGLAAQLVYCHGRAHGRPGDNPAALYSRQPPTPDLPGALRARQGGQDRLPLPYLGEAALRGEIHEGLNVVETWNSANDFIFFGKGGEVASNRLEDQEISCTRSTCCNPAWST